MKDWSNAIKSLSYHGVIFWHGFFAVYSFLSEVQSQNSVPLQNEVILPQIHRNKGRLDSSYIATHLFLQNRFVN